MKPLGKTYLIQIEQQKQEVLAGGIIVPKENRVSLVYYKGIIKQIGLGFHNDNIVKINDKVYFDWKQKKGKVKLILGQKIFYIVEENLILGIEE